MLFYKNKHICRQTLSFFFKNKLFFKKKAKVLRCSTVVSNQIDYNLFIHNGQNLKKLLVLSFNLNKKVGEFSFTRKPYFFPLRKKKK